MTDQYLALAYLATMRNWGACPPSESPGCLSISSGIWGVPVGDEPGDRSGRRVVRAPFDGADVGSIDVDPDGGHIADGRDGVDVVVGRAAHGDLAGLPHVLPGGLERAARIGGRGLVVAELVFGSGVDSGHAPGLVSVHGRALTDVPDDCGQAPAVVGSDVERVVDVVIVRRPCDLGWEPVVAPPRGRTAGPRPAW